MKPLSIPVWKPAPFVRLLIPLIIGIVLQWYLQFAVVFIFTALACFTPALMLFACLPLAQKFKLQVVQGILLQMILITAGLLLTWNKDVRHRNIWYGNHYREGDYLIAAVSEAPVEKSKSYKAEVTVTKLVRKDSVITAGGKLLLYFSKNGRSSRLRYGDNVLIQKKLNAIKNSGNPGAFDYEQYAAFQQLYHNVYLKSEDWIQVPSSSAGSFRKFLIDARNNILTVLRQHITTGNSDSSRDELGIAEALLIGYTNDLDKDLVQAYSNTGVVHIIAISGMHLGLIYGLLIWIFARLPYLKKSKLLQCIFILGCLWVFSLLTGGSASVIRSAVMFTFITIGTMFFKQASIYNSLAASAFVMLCYNPYYLWDVGFQLSYLAVMGIVIFQKPVYNLWYIKNQWLDLIWKAAALTTAAQILTFPVCIYYFHQFPVLFLLTNLIAVPLSTIILYTAIVLVAFSWIPVIAVYAGKITGALLHCMNTIILFANAIPFAVWDRIPATAITTWFLYGMVIFAGAWLVHRNRNMLQLTLMCCACFLLVHLYIKWKITNQQKLIVYNVPKYQAIDFVQGNTYQFTGDNILLEDGVLQNFHLKPGRIALQLNKKLDVLPSCFHKYAFYQFGSTKIAVLDKNYFFESTTVIPFDYIILSKNVKMQIPELVKHFNCSKFIFDASNSLWKIEKWKQDCDKLHLQYHSIPEQGAFVVDL